MADTEMRASTLAPLGNAIESASKSGAVRLREVPFEIHINLRGDPDDPRFINATNRVTGIALPQASNTSVSLDDLRILWLGPDEWLVVGDDDRQESLIQKLEETFHGQHVSLVDVSAHRTVLELSGSRARDVLEKGCLLDLHPRVFGPGHCVGTVMAKTQVYLEQMDDDPTYRLYVIRSYTRHLASWLMDAMSEFS